MKEKKPVYKKWWFYAIIAFVVLIGVAASQSSDTKESVETAQEVKKEESASKTQKEDDVKESEETKEEAEEPTPEVTKEPKKENENIRLETDDFIVTYDKHKVSKDYKKKPCLLYYYTFENKSDDPTSAAASVSIKCFQDGVQCDTAITSGAGDETGHSVKEVKKGGKIKCCAAFLVKKGKEATVEAEPLFSWDDEETVSQTIKIKK